MRSRSRVCRTLLLVSSCRSIKCPACWMVAHWDAVRRRLKQEAGGDEASAATSHRVEEMEQEEIDKNTASLRSQFHAQMSRNALDALAVRGGSQLQLQHAKPQLQVQLETRVTVVSAPATPTYAPTVQAGEPRPQRRAVGPVVVPRTPEAVDRHTTRHTFSNGHRLTERLESRERNRCAKLESRLI